MERNPNPPVDPKPPVKVQRDAPKDQPAPIDGQIIRGTITPTKKG